MAQTINKKAYYRHRMAALGLTEKEGAEHGMYPDEDGNILQYIRYFNGEPITWIDRRGANLRKINTYKNRRTATEGADIEQFFRPMYIQRYTPENLEELRRDKPGTGKYRYLSKSITGYGALPIPTNKAIEAFNAKTTGGLAVGIEGYFKGVSLAQNGIEATAFTGISTYNIKGMEEYLLRRQLDDFVIMYDGDALRLSDKQKEEGISTARVFAFFNSARKFAEQFFNFCKEHELKTRLHFSMVSDELEQKGIDDLLSDTNKPEEILEHWHTLKTSPFFTFARLGRTNYRQRLDDVFAVKNHEVFYNRHRDVIGENPFSFSGAIYQAQKPERHYNLLEYQKEHTRFKALFNPFKLELDSVKLSVNRYLTETTVKIDNIFNKYNKVCISGPTGVGKNALFLGIKKKGVKGYFERKNERGVIAVPYRSLAQQISSEYGIPSFVGTVTIEDKQRAINAPVMVCTYDTLHHVADIENRILVIDEAHDLVNHYTFRANVLNRVVSLIDQAKKTILISGTPPRMLASLLGFQMVDVHRKESNKVCIYNICTETNSTKSFTATTVAQLAQLPEKENRIHLVYYNNTEELELIRKHLIQSGKYTPEQIEVISRHHIDNGENRVLESIIKRRLIPEGIKIILTTCIIGEGVNIENTNIGNIYAVAINCVDSLRQFVARFREMEVVNVFSIRPPEQKMDKRSLYPAAREVLELSELAVNQLTTLCTFHDHYKKELNNTYSLDELEFFDDIQPNYVHRPELYTYIYQNSEEDPRVDVLRICDEIRQRQISGINNTLFYTMLEEYENISFEGGVDTLDLEVIKESVEDTRGVDQVNKGEALHALRVALLSEPDTVVNAYYLLAKDTGNRHATAKIETFASELLSDDTTAASVYLEAHRDELRQKWFTRYIGAFLRLYFAGVDQDTMREELETYNENTFRVKWRRFKSHMEFQLYDNKRHRLHLTSTHKAEIKARQLMMAWILSEAKDGSIRSDELTKLLNAKFRRLSLNTSLDGVEAKQIVRFDNKKAEHHLEELFSLAIERYHGHRVYYLRDEAPPPFSSHSTPEILNNPLKWLKHLE